MSLNATQIGLAEHRGHGLGIGGGLPLGRYYPGRENEMLFAFTELSTKEDIDNLASELALVFSKDLREANA